MKTIYRFDWKNGSQKVRQLSRSFDNLEDAMRFAESKQTIDIYKSKGRYKVEWIKVTNDN